MIVLLGGIQFGGYWNTGTFDGTVPTVPTLTSIYLRDLRLPGRRRFI